MGLIPEFFPDVAGFEWDDGNSDKNWRQHGVTQAEAEQVFLNRPILIASSPGRSEEETRYFALGHSDLHRRLAIAFAIRKHLLRVISARPMSRRERRFYAQTQATQEDPAV